MNLNFTNCKLNLRRENLNLSSEQGKLAPESKNVCDRERVKRKISYTNGVGRPHSDRN